MNGRAGASVPAASGKRVCSATAGSIRCRPGRRDAPSRDRQQETPPSAHDPGARAFGPCPG
ncbi:hypothetical protein BV133_203 [Blastochloris viridis]|uniref:Uncharacterized protein n=1 Tax=Blastochloris viridis TaxID=1079 RepID=A0A182DUY7_BLAVI|nr:hypothetical protein BV133_203 [Blastochloris viridis]